MAALAWNAAIQNLLDEVFGEAGGKLAGQSFYALLITLVGIFATMVVSRCRRARERGRGGAKQGALRPL